LSKIVLGENFQCFFKAAANGRCAGSSGARRLAASLSAPTPTSPHGTPGSMKPGAVSRNDVGQRPGQPGVVLERVQAAHRRA